MSAALVESVRGLIDARAALKVSEPFSVERGRAWDAWHVPLENLDLPAILAALTEAEALRAQIAASQAREVALREALQSLFDYFDNRSDVEDGTDGLPVPNTAMRCASEIEDALSAPTDTAALRAFGERVWDAGWDAGRHAYDNATDADIDKERGSDIDRVLGGS